MITPETIRLILKHDAIEYLRPSFHNLLDDAVDGGCAFGLQLEFSPWQHGGVITLQIMERSYGQSGWRVELNWPGCGSKSIADSEAFFKLGAQLTDLAKELEQALGGSK